MFVSYLILYVTAVACNLRKCIHSRADVYKIESKACDQLSFVYKKKLLQHDLTAIVFLDLVTNLGSIRCVYDVHFKLLASVNRNTPRLEFLCQATEM